MTHVARGGFTNIIQLDLLISRGGISEVFDKLLTFIISVYFKGLLIIFFFLFSSSEHWGGSCPTLTPGIPPMLISLYYIHHQSVLPKGRSFTASSGTKVAVPQQTQEPRLQFYQGWIAAVAPRCFPHPTFSLTSEQILKDLERSQRHHMEVRRVDLANWALLTSPKFTTWVKYQFFFNFLIFKYILQVYFCLLHWKYYIHHNRSLWARKLNRQGGWLWAFSAVFLSR